MKTLLLLCVLLTAYAADPAFTLVVKTDNPGASSRSQFTLPLNSGFIYDCTVDWGDGSGVQSITNATVGFPDITHSYASAGSYTVRISENVVGGFPTIYFINGGDCLKLLQIANWGEVTWSSFAGAFSGCAHLTITATDEATARTGGVTDFSGAWYNCAALTSFPLLDTSAGTNFGGAWTNCSGLTSFPLLNTAAGWMFASTWSGCSGLMSFPLLNTAAGGDFEFAWSDCSGLTSFPLLDTSRGFVFHWAWYGCSGLTSFPHLDTANGVDFRRAWYGCSGLTTFPTLNLRNMWDGEECFHLVTLPTATYSALLIDMAAHIHYTGHRFDGGNSQFSAGAAATARDVLANHGWMITDGGVETLPSNGSPRSGLDGNGSSVASGCGVGGSLGLLLGVFLMMRLTAPARWRFQ